MVGKLRLPTRKICEGIAKSGKAKALSSRILVRYDHQKHGSKGRPHRPGRGQAKMNIAKPLWVAGCLLGGLSTARALEPFPLEAPVNAAKSHLAAAHVAPTALERADYLSIISGVAGYFRHFQAEDGRIIDPFLRQEFQYST